ncbi:DUF5329 domain-containing protein [uncultured Luteimonas sp.]|uniref:DUF5329 domain-containing protein n=1 Tax=uncultured Luteimonas sp. TaxID=453144 RepID=UPI00263946D2|nr:DUF5329 domain-containing protein [uncultured Luteimonas sp.]
MACVAGVLLVAILQAVPAHASDPDTEATAGREIAALIEAVGESGCRFQRNGRWHPPAAAQAHLQRKLETARRRGLHGGAEDFIARIASRSSLTGRAYRVRCGDGPEQPASDWFDLQLQRLREADSSRSPR